MPKTRLAGEFRKIITAYETHTVTSQKQLEGTGVTRKGDSNSWVPAPPLTIVAKRRQCSHRSIKYTLQIFTDASKKQKRHSLKRAHCKRSLVPSGKQTAYKLPRTQGSFSSLKRVPRHLLRQDSICSNRQYHSSVINKQERRHEVGPTLCPTMGNFDLVYLKSSNSQSPTQPRLAEHGSRQAIQARPDHPNRVVSPSRGRPDNMQQVAPPKNRPFCHKVQQQVASVCVTGTRSPGHSSGYTHSGFGRICLPTSSHIGQSGGEAEGLPMQENHSDCSGVAQHALVLGSSGHVQPNPTNPALSTQCINTALQSDPSEKPDKPYHPCMAPRASAIKGQGFSEAVAARLEAPQRGTTSL